MNRSQRRKLGLTKEVTQSIEYSERARTIDTFTIAVAATLWDTGCKEETIKKMIAKIWDLFDSFNRNYATVEDYRLMLKDEAHISFSYCDKERRGTL